MESRLKWNLINQVRSNAKVYVSNRPAAFVNQEVVVTYMVSSVISANNILTISAISFKYYETLLTSSYSTHFYIGVAVSL